MGLGKMWNSVKSGVSNFFGGKSGLGKAGINTFDPEVRGLGDKEFRRELRAQARGKNLGPNIAAAEGRAAMDANLAGQRTGMASTRDQQQAALEMTGEQAANARADTTTQASAARADVAGMNRAQMKEAIRAQTRGMNAARAAASSMAASGRGANVASARYMAANQAAAAQTGVAAETAAAQRQIAEQGNLTQRGINRELTNAQRSVNRDLTTSQRAITTAAGNERSNLLRTQQDARVTMGKNTANAAASENVQKTTAAKGAYLGTLSANQQAGISRDQMKAGITNANAANQGQLIGSGAGMLGTAAAGLMMLSDINSKEDVKLSEPPRLHVLGDAGKQMGPDYAGYKASVEAQGFDKDAWAKDQQDAAKKDEKKKAGLGMLMSAFGGMKSMSDIRSKENIAPARNVTQAAMSRAGAMFGAGGAVNKNNQMQAAQQRQAQQGGVMNAARQSMGGMLGGMGGGTRRPETPTQRTSGAMNAARMAGGLGGMMSDEESKEDIKREAVREVFDELRPYKFRYKEDDAERMAEDFDDPRAAYNELREERYGVMAQDMEKTPEGKKAVSSMHDRKAIDGPKALGLALAEIADLHDRLEALEAGRKGRK
jgi:hypothetical protein